MASPKSGNSLNCMCSSMRRATRLMTRMYDEALSRAGVSASQFELLANIRGRQPVDQRTLVRAIDSDQTTLSRNLAVLLERGWIEMFTDERDKRRSLYRLTKAGATTLSQAFACWEEVQAKLQQRIGGTQWKELMDLTNEVANAITEL
ncbi:MAG TPA: MarR family winged helix-turn-helix transcriptional regulator [Edaphobacter sp.]